MYNQMHTYSKLTHVGQVRLSTELKFLMSVNVDDIDLQPSSIFSLLCIVNIQPTVRPAEVQASLKQGRCLHCPPPSPRNCKVYSPLHIPGKGGGSGYKVEKGK
jgi:hypothetical protein